MRHEWHITYFGLRSIMQQRIRVCAICYAIQEHVTDHEWMRVVGYRWSPAVGRCRTHTDEEAKKMMTYLMIDEKEYWAAVRAALGPTWRGRHASRL